MDDDDDDDDRRGDEKELPALSLSKQSKTASRTNRRVTSSSSSSSPRGLKDDESVDAEAFPSAKLVKKDQASKPRSDGQRGIGRGDDDVDARFR